VVNGRIYVGLGGPEQGPYGALAYDANYGFWLFGSTPPPQSTFGASAIGCAGKVYVIGGGQPTATATVLRYDPSTDSWLQVASMNTARSRACVAEVNGKILVVGPTLSAEMYDPGTDTWTVVAPPPSGAAYFSATAAVIGSKVYVMGGGTTIPNNVCRIYDSITESWTVHPAPMPSKRAMHVAGAARGLIYVMGGLTEDGTGAPVDGTIDVFDPVAGEWGTKARPLSKGRYQAAGGAVGDTLYLLLGQNEPFSPPFNFRDGDEYRVLADPFLLRKN
jgi:N-acetylneuraminic acid mutarotase